MTVRVRRQGVVVGVALTGVLAITLVVGACTTGSGAPSSGAPSSGATIPAQTPTPTPTPTPSLTTSSTPGWTDAQYKLYNVVPSGFADSCKPVDVTNAKLKPNVVAAIRCDPGSSGTPDNLDYYRYSSKTATKAAFKGFTGKAASAGCDGTSTDWSNTKTPKTIQGQRTCFERGTSQLIVWYDVKAHILYRAGSRKMTEAQQHAWWKEGKSW